MYHTTDFKKWFHHFHLPGHETLIYIEKLLRDKRLWRVAAVVFITFALMMFLVWVLQSSSNAMQELPISRFIPMFHRTLSVPFRTEGIIG